MNLNKFVIFLLFISSLNIYCQNSIKNYSKNIKITKVESTSDYYVYRFIEYKRCIADTLIILEKKAFNQLNNSLETDKYYQIKYEHESIMAKPSQNNNFIKDNIRLSGHAGMIKLISSQQIDSLNINELILGDECLTYYNYENFEIFLQKFINDENYRNSRINFNDHIKHTKKQFKKWKKAENLLLNYKLNKFKRDKVYYEDYKNMHFRIYKGDFFDTSMIFISFTFRLDENNQWYLFNFNNLNDTW